MQADTQSIETVCPAALMNHSTGIDQITENESKFRIGQLLKGRAAQRHLVRLLGRETKRLLQAGGEITESAGSLKKKKDGNSCGLLHRAKLGKTDCKRQLKLLLRNGSF